MTKKIIWGVLNLFFIGVFFLALWVLFFKKNGFDDEKIVADSQLKGKTFAALPVEITLTNGMRAWLMEENSAPLVALDFYFDKAGYAFDDENEQGLAAFVSSMLLKRAGDMDDESFQNLLNENAIEIKVNVLDDVFEISAAIPKNHLNVAAKMLNTILTAPNINENDAEVTKRRQLTKIDMQNENPESVLIQKFKERLFLNHPKARLSLGTKEAVAGFSGTSVKHFADKHFKTNNLTIALAGNVSKEEAVLFLDRVFDGLTYDADVTDLPPLTVNFEAKEENINRDMPQVISFFAAPGVKRLSEDFYPLYIANEIFGGSGLTSRLNLHAREKEGLTYGIYTYLDTDNDAPRIVGMFSSSVQNYEKMREILLNEWQKMAVSGVTKQEFEDIQNNMLSAFHLRFSSLGHIVKQLLFMQKENLGIDFFQKRNEYVANVSIEAVNAAAKKYFVNKPSILTIGNNDNGDK